MNAPEPTIRSVHSLTAEEEERVLELLKRAFRGWWFRLPGRPVDHLRWKIRGAPWGALAQLMEVNSRLVGYRLNLTRRILVHGQEYTARDGVDLAIDPDFQGRGLLRKMNHHIDELSTRQFDFTFGYDTHPASRHTMAERDRREPGNRIRELIKVLDIRRSVSGRRLIRPGKSAWLYAHRLVSRARCRLYRPRVPAPSISAIQRFDGRVNAFFTEASKPFDFIHLRTDASLNWRYCDPRGGAFTVLLAEDGERILGYLAFNLMADMVRIADILALPGRQDVVWSLLEDALHRCDVAGAASVRCRLPATHPYDRVLRLHGFLASGQGSGATYGPGRLSTSALSFLAERDARIHLALGDSDHV
jgi:hypothetical protein